MIHGHTITIAYPSFLGLLHLNRYWELTFICGNCGAKPTVQHDEEKNWHKCPVCKEVNILDVVCYWDF